MVVDILAIAALCIVLVVSGYVSSYVMDHGYWPWHRHEVNGCCPTCRGTGVGGDAETNGMCWDCKATGHPHPGKCTPWWRRRG